MESVLNIDCSMYASAKATTPQAVNLLQWLKSDKYLKDQQRIRAIIDEGQRQAAKLQMPCISPSGIFSKRGKEHLIKHTGLMAVDIDKKDNPHLSNFAELKKEICRISNIAYCGLSISGNGYWLLIPIAQPQHHEEHFKFIEAYFKRKGLIIDSACKDVSRLRFYSFDPEAYFNHAAKPLQAIYRHEPKDNKKAWPKAFKGEEAPTWEQYNQSENFINVLLRHGWQIEREQGAKIHFTRPGKAAGISAEYDRAKNVFFVFSSSAPPFEGSKGYNPFAIYALLEHDGDFRKAAKSLMTDRKAAPRIPPPAKNTRAAFPALSAQVKAGQQSSTQKQAVNLPAEIREIKAVSSNIDKCNIERGLSIQQLREMAFKHFNSSAFRASGGTMERYFVCWVNDMEKQIKAAGGDRVSFLNQLITCEEIANV